MNCINNRYQTGNCKNIEKSQESICECLHAGVNYEEKAADFVNNLLQHVLAKQINKGIKKLYEKLDTRRKEEL